MYKQHPRTPVHIFLDDTPYFITGAIYQRRHLLSDTLRQRLQRVIQETFLQSSWTLQHWVVLDNHYHLLAMSGKGTELSKIMKRIHGVSAHFIAETTQCERPIWWNYWDYCPRNEQDYFTHLNYLLNNPVKHGYVQSLYDYPFSSFHDLIYVQGRARLVQQFKTYADYHDANIFDEF
jgi:putative transposase